MVESADDARKRAIRAAATLRLVNDIAAGPLVAAADRGETSVLIDVDPVDLTPLPRLTGRLHDNVLIEALENAGAANLAQACRIFIGLGFALSAVPGVKREQAADRVGYVIRSIRIAQIELGFAAAQEIGRSAQAKLPKAVAMPPAHQWRVRAESARLLHQHERKALAVVAEHAERGADCCKLTWRELSTGPFNGEHLNRLAESLRGRGFRVEPVDAGSTLRLNW